MGESWIVSNLNAALSTWNDKLAEIWSLLTESPQTFKGGQVWGVMTGIHGALQAIGYGLLVLFFAVGVMKTCGSFVEVKKPEHALKLFIRFALAKGAVDVWAGIDAGGVFYRAGHGVYDYYPIGQLRDEQRDTTTGVDRRHQQRRLLGFYSTVGGHIDRRAADYGFILHHDPHGLRQNVQPVDVRSHCADTAVYLCG